MTDTPSRHEQALQTSSQALLVRQRRLDELTDDDAAAIGHFFSWQNPLTLLPPLGLGGLTVWVALTMHMSNTNAMVAAFAAIVGGIVVDGGRRFVQFAAGLGLARADALRLYAMLPFARTPRRISWDEHDRALGRRLLDLATPRRPPTER